MNFARIAIASRPFATIPGGIGAKISGKWNVIESTWTYADFTTQRRDLPSEREASNNVWSFCAAGNLWA
jgi:hypothetical protein